MPENPQVVDPEIPCPLFNPPDFPNSKAENRENGEGDQGREQAKESDFFNREWTPIDANKRRWIPTIFDFSPKYIWIRVDAQGNQARDFSTADGHRFTQIKEAKEPSIGETQAEMS